MVCGDNDTRGELALVYAKTTDQNAPRARPTTATGEAEGLDGRHDGARVRVLLAQFFLGWGGDKFNTPDTVPLL